MPQVEDSIDHTSKTDISQTCLNNGAKDFGAKDFGLLDATMLLTRNSPLRHSRWHLKHDRNRDIDNSDIEKRKRHTTGGTSLEDLASPCQSRVYTKFPEDDHSQVRGDKMPSPWKFTTARGKMHCLPILTSVEMKKTWLVNTEFKSTTWSNTGSLSQRCDNLDWP